MIIGFLGTGVITEAIIRGLYDAAQYEGTILVSRRSEKRSQRLSETYPNVRVVDQNQELAEQSDWIVVSVLPEQVSEVLSELSIRQDQKVVSLAAGVSLDELRAAAAPALPGAAPAIPDRTARDGSNFWACCSVLLHVPRPQHRDHEFT